MHSLMVQVDFQDILASLYLYLLELIMILMDFYVQVKLLKMIENQNFHKMRKTL